VCLSSFSLTQLQANAALKINCNAVQQYKYAKEEEKQENNLQKIETQPTKTSMTCSKVHTRTWMI
jgi:hypothetical protein